MKSLELREKRAKLLADCRSIVDAAEKDGRATLNSDEEERYGKLWADAEKLQTEITRAEKLEAEERDLERSIDDSDDEPLPGRDNDPEAEQRGEGINSPEYREMFNRHLVDPKYEGELRALSAGTDTEGGYITSPEEFVAQLIKSIDDQVFIRPLATVRQTQAVSLGIPSLDADPADSNWTAELGTGSEDSTMAFGKRELKPHPVAKRIKVSRKLLRAALMGAEALVRERLAYKFAITEEKAFLAGTGAEQPLGVFTASDNGIGTARDVSTGNTTTAFTTDGLKECKYSLKGGYWGRARWIFHRDAVKMLSKLKDGDGRYIWTDSVIQGDPDRLLGFPVSMSEYAPNTFTTGLYVGLLGDFSYYWIADAMGLDIQVLTELYAATNQNGYIGRLETDGMPVLAEAFARVKLA